MPVAGEVPGWTDDRVSDERIGQLHAGFVAQDRAPPAVSLHETNLTFDSEFSGTCAQRVCAWTMSSIGFDHTAVCPVWFWALGHAPGQVAGFWKLLAGVYHA